MTHQLQLLIIHHFLLNQVTYSALIGTYPSNYEIITYTGKGTNTLTGVTRCFWNN